MWDAVLWLPANSKLPIHPRHGSTQSQCRRKAHTEPASIPVEKQEPAKPRGLLSRIRYYEEVLDRKLGIESHSLDRVLPENRKPPNSLAMALMWASATINISCFSTGFLGKKFGLSLGQTIAITICATALGAAVTVRIPFPISLYLARAICSSPLGFQRLTFTP